MAGTQVIGQRGTGNVLQDLRRIDMAERILDLEPSVTPLTVISGRLGSRPTVNPEFSWTENEFKARFDEVDGTTGTGTTVKVKSAAKFSVHNMVLVSTTGELMRVTAVDTAGDELTVARGVGGRAVSLNGDEELIIVGSAQPEGDLAPDARSQNPVKVTNYTQIYRTSFESTGTLIASDMFTRPHDWDYNAAQAGAEHKKDQEYTRLFGRPSEDLSGGSNGQPLRTTGGVFHYVQTNVQDLSGSSGVLTESEFWAWCDPAFRYGSRHKLLLASRLVTSVLNEFPRAKLITVDRASTYGVDVQRLVSPFGTMDVVTHNMLEGEVYGGTAVLLDMQQIKRRHLANSKENRDTHIRTNIQPPDMDGRKDEYLTEDGLEFGLERCHAILEGVVSAGTGA